ncbi:MAG: hypothetical protein JWR28_2797, partial [Modestobacter sp.]|nr:hypothetical protein [Modestobacter sp.]
VGSHESSVIFLWALLRLCLLKDASEVRPVRGRAWHERAVDHRRRTGPVPGRSGTAEHGLLPRDWNQMPSDGG